MSFRDTRITYDLAKHLDSNSIDSLMPETKANGKSSIPLATCDYDSASDTSVNSRPLSLLFKPISEDELNSCATRDLIRTSFAAEEEEEESASLAQLRDELDEHFRRLKTEFEVKRGVTWTPLRPWASEEWEWNDEGGAEAEGGFDWC